MWKYFLPEISEVLGFLLFIGFVIYLIMCIIRNCTEIKEIVQNHGVPEDEWDNRVNVFPQSSNDFEDF